MRDWSDAPVFGVPDPRFPCVVRPSVYTLIFGTGGQLAIVRTASGAHLPGGGIDRDESPEDAALREAREECGLAIQLGAWRRVAIDHVVVPAEGASFEKRSIFADATVAGSGSQAAEPDHELAWVSPRDAIATLVQASQRWAVSEWLESELSPSHMSYGA